LPFSAFFSFVEVSVFTCAGQNELSGYIRQKSSNALNRSRFFNGYLTPLLCIQILPHIYRVQELQNPDDDPCIP
jgi:hypothetical protein